jgi:hypothetical protein
LKRFARRAVRQNAQIDRQVLPLGEVADQPRQPAPQIPAARIRALAEGGYIERSEPVVLIGECGTGKSHLATGLCLAACRQKRSALRAAARLPEWLIDGSPGDTAADYVRPRIGARTKDRPCGLSEPSHFVYCTSGSVRRAREKPRASKDKLVLNRCLCFNSLHGHIEGLPEA